MIRAVLSWLGQDFFRAPFVAVLAVLLVHWFVTDPALRTELAQAEIDLTLEMQAHAQSNINHALAAAEAGRLDRANVKRVKAEAATESKEIVDDLEIRLSDARQRADAAEQRLRGQANAPARASGGAAAGMPALSRTATGVGQAACDCGLPATGIAAGADGDMSIQERLIATEQALQLDALIQWVNAMGLIDVNGPPEDVEAVHGRE